MYWDRGFIFKLDKQNPGKGFVIKENLNFYKK